MESIVKVQDNQVVEADDFNNFGLFPRASLDHVVKDAITDGAGFVQFGVVQSGPAEVTVAAGRLYRNGAVYAKDEEGGVTVDLLALLPAVTRRIVAIVVWGNAVDTNTQPRTFLTNVETGATEGVPVSIENRRVAYIDRVSGVENVDPQPPAVDANVLAVAHVTLNTTGIEKIQMIDANRLVSVKSLNTRLAIVEKRLDLAGSRIDTLGTDISGLSQLLRGKAPMSTVVALAADFARTKRLAGLPDDYMAWAADNFADESLSDTDHGDYDCFIKDGLRFGEAAFSSTGLALQNALDDRIQVINNMVFPRPKKVTRVSIRGRDAEVALASYTSSTTDRVEKTRTRTETIVLGLDEAPPSAPVGDWQISTYNSNIVGDENPTVTQMRRRLADGSWEILGNTANEYIYEYDTNPAVGTVVGVRHPWYHVIEKTISEPYWEAVTVESTVQGFQIAQTFLNAQEGGLMEINLFFTRKAASGDVHAHIVELDATGKPNEKAVLAKLTKTPAQINADPTGATATTFEFDNASLVKGRRYGIWVVSQGAHWLAQVSGNKYAQGQFFQKNDGEWLMPSASLDLAMELVFSGYDRTRIEVQLNPATLAGGIETLSLSADTARPDGTSIIFEMNPGTGWVPFTGEPITPGGPLSAQPALVQLRAVLIGTTDAMPGFGIGTRSALVVSRSDTGMVHISSVRTLPAAADTVEVTLRAVHWDAGDHTLVAKLLTGVSYTTVETADATVDMPEPVTPMRLKTKKFVFNVSPSISSYKIRIEGASSNALKHFIVAERTDVAFAE